MLSKRYESTEVDHQTINAWWKMMHNDEEEVCWLVGWLVGCGLMSN